MSDQPMLGIPDDQTWNGYAWVPTTDTDPMAGQPLVTRIHMAIIEVAHGQQVNDHTANRIAHRVVELLAEVSAERSADAMVEATTEEPDGAEAYWQYRVDLAGRRGEEAADKEAEFQAAAAAKDIELAEDDTMDDDR